jgi:hypothetical protein
MEEIAPDAIHLIEAVEDQKRIGWGQMVSWKSFKKMGRAIQL